MGSITGLQELIGQVRFRGRDESKTAIRLCSCGARIDQEDGMNGLMMMELRALKSVVRWKRDSISERYSAGKPLEVVKNDGRMSLYRLWLAADRCFWLM